MASIKRDELAIEDNPLASGGFGAVYRGIWKTKENRPVAVKKLLIVDLKEIETLKRLQHLNIVSFFGYVKESTDLMIVMELCELGSLKSFLAGRKDIPLSPHLIFDWLLHAALPIQYLRSQRIEHMDIKTDNYVITGAMVLKLTDFGLSIDLESTKSFSSETGSWRWMPPERLRDHKLSPKFSIYALALVFWCLFTREIPYAEYESNFTIAHKVCFDKERPKIPSNCPAPLADLIRSSWDDDRSKRPDIEHVIATIVLSKSVFESKMHESTTQTESLPTKTSVPTQTVDTTLISTTTQTEPLITMKSVDSEAKPCYAMNPRSPTVTERAILVANIPYITDDLDQLKDRLESYFGKRNHGGGDVNSIICPIAGTVQKAIIVFESEDVCRSVIQHGDHIFEEEAIQVQAMPSVVKHVEAEINVFYWNLIPRLDVAQVVDTLRKILGPSNLKMASHVVTHVTCTLRQLEEIQAAILQAVGLRPPRAISENQGVMMESSIDCGISVKDIPLLTNDPIKVKEELRKHFGMEGDSNLNHLICPVNGSMKEAIVVFETVEARAEYVTRGDFCIYGEIMTVTHLPQVFRKVTANLDTVYMQLITRRKLNYLHAQLTEKCGSAVILTGNRTTGPFEDLMDVISILMEAIGFPPSEHVEKIQIHTCGTYITQENTSDKPKPSYKDVDNGHPQEVKLRMTNSTNAANHTSTDVPTTSDVNPSDKTDRLSTPQDVQKSKTSAKEISSEESGRNDEIVYANSKKAEEDKGSKGLKALVSKPQHETVISPEMETFGDPISVDAMTYNYLRKTAYYKLNQIKSKFNVTIELQTPDSKMVSEQIVLLKPKRTGNIVISSPKDQDDAREAFITLYHDVFFSIRRVQLKCHGLPDKTAASAQKDTEKRVKAVVIQKDKHNQEYVFCGEEKAVIEAVKIFREKAGIQPQPRRLKHSSSTGLDDFSNNDNEPRNHGNLAEKYKEHGNAENVPSHFPSMFYTKEGLEITVQQDDITKQHVDIIVNEADGRLNNIDGVAAAISRAAGNQLQWDCNKIMWGRQPFQTTQCIETRGYKLPCQYVIHAVGPEYQKHMDPNVFFGELANTFMNVLQLAVTKGANTIAIPLISSGNFGGPKDICTNALATALSNFSTSRQKGHLKQVFLVNIDEGATIALQSNFSGIFLTPTEKEDSEMESPSDVAQQTTSTTTKFKTNEGIEVVVVKGDITKGDVGVIVNAANGHLRHGSGVAGAIAQAAGKRIQDESNQIIAQRKKPLRVGECVATDGYNLKCKVIHAVGPIYKKCQSDKEFSDLLKTTFLEAIKYANLTVEAKRVAIPLISSGIYGGPKDLCAKTLTEAVKEFSKNVKNLVIKHIYLVNIDEETTDAVRTAFNTHLSSEVDHDPSKTAVRHDGSNHSKQRQASLDGVDVKSKRGISLRVIRGDITKQKVDVIVNPTTPTLCHNGGVARAISDAAGYRLQQHCTYILKEERKNKELGVGETVVTPSHNLPCTNIIHTLGPNLESSNPNKFCQLLQQTFVSCLNHANSIQVETIAFPLIGSSFGLKETCAKAFAEAVSELEETEANINLRCISLVSTNENSLFAVQKIFGGYFSALPTTVEELTDSTGTIASDADAEYIFRTTENMEVRLRTEDITKQSVDVIFNSTDQKLTNMGNISTRLCKAAGPRLQQKCNELIKGRKSLSPGSFLTTGGFNLPCQQVLHVSTPLRGKQSDVVFTGFLQSTYIASLLYAKGTLRAKSVALPLIGSESESSKFCAQVLASALKQFSRQTKCKPPHITISIVSMRSSDTDAINNAFSDNFRLERLDKRDKHTPSPARREVPEDNTYVRGIIESNRIAKQPSKGQAGRGSNQNEDQKRNKKSSTQFPNNRKNNPGATSNSNQVRYSGALKGSGQISGSGYNSYFMNTNPSSSDPMCLICKNQKEKLHILGGCGHQFCFTCIRDKITPQETCQECGSLYGLVTEDDLGGKMTYYVQRSWKLEGSSHEHDEGVIVMVFEFANGIQNNAHPMPGKKFYGLKIFAFLPGTEEGLDTLFLLQIAFLKKHLFTVSTSKQHGDQRVTLADIPLKLQICGGSSRNGYPDPGYLYEVKMKLKEKGIVPKEQDETSV